MCGQERHQRESFKLIQPYANSWAGVGSLCRPTLNHVKKTKRLDVIGESQEVTIEAQKVPCRAIIDTGSQVTTVAEWFYKSHLQDCPTENLDEIIEIKLADGKHL